MSPVLWAQELYTNLFHKATGDKLWLFFSVFLKNTSILSSYCSSVWGILLRYENLSISAYSKNVKCLHRILLGFFFFLCTKCCASQDCAYCLLCWHCSVVVANNVVLSHCADCVLDICWLWFGCFTHWAEEFWDHWGMIRSTWQPQGPSRGAVECRPRLT